MTGLVYTRDSSQKVVDRHGKVARRGVVVVGGVLSLPTIERAEGYKALPPGTYDCIFAPWRARGGRPYPAIRVLGLYSKNRIYFHPANWAYQLSGCIAPGVEESDDGVSRSRDALELIFEALGGYSEGLTVALEVFGVVA